RSGETMEIRKRDLIVLLTALGVVAANLLAVLLNKLSDLFSANPASLWIDVVILNGLVLLVACILAWLQQSDNSAVTIRPPTIRLTKPRLRRIVFWFGYGPGAITVIIGAAYFSQQMDRDWTWWLSTGIVSLL